MAPGYLMVGQQSELERLQLRSRVWEPAGQALLRAWTKSGRSAWVTRHVGQRARRTQIWYSRRRAASADSPTRP